MIIEDDQTKHDFGTVPTQDSKNVQNISIHYNCSAQILFECNVNTTHLYYLNIDLNLLQKNQPSLYNCTTFISYENFIIPKA